ncbi:MAG: beta-lactamase family protein [Desulfuromonadales bacterium]|nr:beta-lactamase family protein [Desulfuromonadales bacterium]
MLLKVWLGMVLMVCVLTGCSTMPKRPENLPRGDYTYTTDYISWLARSEMNKHGITGLSIALVDDRQVVWAAGFGFADKAGNVPATAETVYRAGSISKLFTATAIMQLAEQGLLDIDKPLQNYLPEFSIKSRFPDAGPITQRNIMTHHSGIPSDLLKGAWSKNPEPFTNVVNLLREGHVAYPPDFVNSYSDLGVSVLGHALEKVVGRGYVSHMTTALLRPLGMADSSFSQAPDHSPAASKAYRNGEEAEDTPLRDIPAGGLNSTVLDLSRFMQMILAGGRAGERQIIKTETLAEMLRPQNETVALDLSFRIGLGWMLGGQGDIDIRNAGPIAHHSGITLYHRSMLIVLPEQKLGVVVLSNSATGTDAVLKLATEALKAALEAKSGIRQPERETAGTGAGTTTRAELQVYAGRYATDVGVVTLNKKTDQLQAKIMNKTLSFVPRADGLLGLQYKLLGLIPISLGELDRVGIGRTTIAGRDIVTSRLDGQELLFGERIADTQLPEAWLKRQGEYEIINAGDDYLLVKGIHLRYDAGLLVMEYELPLFSKSKMSVALNPLNNTEALILGLGRGMGETIRVVSVGGDDLLQFSGYLLRKKHD